jgi:hypothetical protein
MLQLGHNNHDAMKYAGFKIHESHESGKKTTRRPTDYTQADERSGLR